jgi:hypothetical protein
LWWRCTHLGQTSVAGALFDDVAAALSEVGQPGLQAWPYNGTLGAGSVDPPDATGEPPWQTIETVFIDLAHDGVESELGSMLEAGRPLVLVVEVTPEFEEPDADDHIVLPDIRSAAGDYHAVLAVGVAAHEEHGRCLLVRNSWGIGWGAGGYAWMPVRYLEAFCVQAGLVESSVLEKQEEKERGGP